MDCSFNSAALKIIFYIAHESLYKREKDKKERVWRKIELLNVKEETDAPITQGLLG